ncbi:hypothetical protein KSP40_PGU005814 [Platanthera guangdongensis]|uniref:Small auxin up regulated protein n=1 Tax=Platanthera guangdongensis TaxID=2320717 RepID=A0ABR2MLY3_9ASPA
MGIGTKIAALRRRRAVAMKGHVFVRSGDGRRFLVPLSYLTTSIFRELLRISEEEYGLRCDGPIMMPCDASTMEYIISLLRCCAPLDVEMALLLSIFSSA